jgi:hypothetical protein
VSDIKVGDRVKYVLNNKRYSNNPNIGKVGTVRSLSSGTEYAYAYFDGAEYGAYCCFIGNLEKVKPVSYNRIKRPVGYGKNPYSVDVNLPDFRAIRVPLGPYETSYTKKVVDKLNAIPNVSVSLVINDAIALLKQYHRDLALPYQQRDEARAEAKRLRAALDVAEAQLSHIDQVLRI